MLDFLVLVAGLEPARCCHRGILSPLRLPIPPHQQAKDRIYYPKMGPIGLEPMTLCL